MTGESRVLKRRGLWRLWVALGVLLVVGVPGGVMGRLVRIHGWGYLRTLSPVYDLWPYETVHEVSYEDVRVVLQRDRRRPLVFEPENGNDRLLVYRGDVLIDKIVRPAEREISIAWLDSMTSKDAGLGDFDGDGIIDLLVMEWSNPYEGTGPDEIVRSYKIGTVCTLDSVFPASYGSPLRIVSGFYSPPRLSLERLGLGFLKPRAGSGFDTDPFGASDPSLIGPQRP